MANTDAVKTGSFGSTAAPRDRQALGYNYLLTRRMEATPMGYLVLSRKEGESIHLSIAPDADPTTVLEQLRAGIYIDAAQIKGDQAKLGIEAPDSVVMMRVELLGCQSDASSG